MCVANISSNFYNFDAFGPGHHALYLQAIYVHGLNICSPMHAYIIIPHAVYIINAHYLAIHQQYFNQLYT